MCWTIKTVYTVCAHSKIRKLQGSSCSNNASNNNPRDCMRSYCQHTQSLRAIYGFCEKCVEAFAPQPTSTSGTTSSYNIIKNYWAYKNSKDWNIPVDAENVPIHELLLTGSSGSVSNPLKKGLFVALMKAASPKPAEGSIRGQMLALLDAMDTLLIRQQSCFLCCEGFKMDFRALARQMCESTLEWAKKFGESDLVIRQAYFTCAEELSFFAARAAADSPRRSDFRERLSSASARSSEDFPMRRHGGPQQPPQQSPASRTSSDLASPSCSRQTNAKHKDSETGPSKPRRCGLFVTNGMSSTSSISGSPRSRKDRFSDFSDTEISHHSPRHFEKKSLGNTHESPRHFAALGPLDPQQYPSQCHEETYAKLVGWGDDLPEERPEDEQDTVEERFDFHLDDGTGSLESRVRRMTFISSANLMSSRGGSPEPPVTALNPPMSLSRRGYEIFRKGYGMRPESSLQKGPEACEVPGRYPATLPTIPPTTPIRLPYRVNTLEGETGSSSGQSALGESETFGSISAGDLPMGLGDGTFGSSLGSSSGAPERRAPIRSATAPSQLNQRTRWCATHGCHTPYLGCAACVMKREGDVVDIPPRILSRRYPTRKM